MISTTTSTASYTATAGQTVFAYPFRIQNQSDLLVFAEDTLGVRTNITANIVSVSAVDNEAGGNVTLPAQTLNTIIYLVRASTFTQLWDASALNFFDPATVERVVDKLTILMQEVRTDTKSCLRLDDGELLDPLDKAARKGKIPAFNTTTGALEYVDAAGLIAEATEQAAIATAQAAIATTQAGISNTKTIEAAASAALAASYQAKIEVVSIAALKALSVASLLNNDAALVLGYYGVNDGGGGLFYYDSSSSSADNGGTIIQPTSGSGRWIRVYGDLINARWFGAKGDGVTDDSSAVSALMTFVRTGSGLSSPSGGDSISKLGAYFSAGTYLVTTSEVLLPSSYTTKTRGFKLLGAGRGQTFIWFKPTAGTRYLMNGQNSYLVNDISDISFISDSISNTFLYSVSNTGGCQRWNFTRCEWGGMWGRAVHLTGGNNNSEWTFHDCGVSGEMTEFLYIPDVGGSDQFLNFWFDKMKFWPTESARPNCWINVHKGGHIKIDNCDASGLQNGTLFKLNGITHAYGVCSFSCDGTRFEMKSNNVKVIESYWPFGNITFSRCDFGSQATVYSLATVAFELYDVNNGGSLLTFDSCSLIGSIKFNHQSDDFRHSKKRIFLNCEHLQTRDFTNCFIFASTTNDGGHGLVVLENCRGSGTPIDIFTGWAALTAYSLTNQRANGASIYECTVAGTSAASGGPTGKGSAITDGSVTWKWIGNDLRDYQSGSCVMGFRDRAGGYGKRYVASFKNASGQLPPTPQKIEMILPPNAIVVSARIQCPAGATGSGYPPAYSIRTSETLLSYTAATISAAAADNSINDSSNSFPAFAAGDRISITGFTGASTTANAVATVVSRTVSKIILSGVTLINDAAGESVTVSGPGYILDLASIGSAASSGYDMGFSGFIPLGTTDARRTLVFSGATDQFNGTANAIVEYIA